MKIAQIAPLVESVPPTLYGGTERVVSWLTEELVHQGHDVTLFASGDSQTSARLEPIIPRALRLQGVSDCIPANTIMLDKLIARQRDFDVLHFHVEFFHYPLFRNLAHRTLTTLHGRQDLPNLPALYRAFPNMPLVSISDHQRPPAADVNWRGTVHHGMPPDLFRLGGGSGGYLAFLGRICADKGILPAIEIARRAGLELKVAAKVDPADQDYFEEQVRPVLQQSPHVDYIGEINDSQKQQFLGEARALLFPISWPEPFGLVMIESMACGTPVIAFRWGSVPEVMEDGVTGFVVETVEQAAEAVPKLAGLSRHAIRARFDKRFSVRAMARAYVTIYEILASEETVAVAAE
jgi:glycosyltransferase involved in cell wall biosynthesis